MRRIYTEEEEKFLAEALPKGTYEDVLKAFNAKYEPITRVQLQRFRYRRHIPIGGPSELWLNTIRSNAFQVGHKCPFAKEPGAVRRTVNGSVQKQADGTWKRMSRVVWEQHHGAIPEGFVIVQIDGDIDNYDIDNLEMISRVEQSIMNLYKFKYHNRDEFYTCLGVARLTIATKKQKEKRHR